VEVSGKVTSCPFRRAPTGNANRRAIDANDERSIMIDQSGCSTFRRGAARPFPAAFGTAMTETKLKRRWFRFSQRTLLVLFLLVAIVAVAAGWYVNRLRIIKLEREKLVGMWELDSGLVIDIQNDRCDVGVPTYGVGQIDFHAKTPFKFPDGTSTDIVHAIYRIDGDRIQIAEAYPGKERPNDFEKRTDSRTAIVSGKRVAPSKSE